MIQIDLHKRLNGPKGIFDLQFTTQIHEGSFTTIYGKSGVGKTSVLRMIAGLMKPDKGYLQSGEEIWFGPHTLLSPQRRNIGMVFQEVNLFPNMTVAENLKFALKNQKDTDLLDHAIEIMEIKGLLYQKPLLLSGGQKQRVALARAIVQRPTILLLDEPLAALDQEMRIKLQQYISKAHKEYQFTTLMISHDISEIIKLSDRVIEIHDGKILRDGNPKEVFMRDHFLGEFQFVGEIIELKKYDFYYSLVVLIGNDLVKVIVGESEANSLVVGDSIALATKAFNPIIQKIE